MKKENNKRFGTAILRFTSILLAVMVLVFCAIPPARAANAPVIDVSISEPDVWVAFYDSVNPRIFIFDYNGSSPIHIVLSRIVEDEVIEVSTADQSVLNWIDYLAVYVYDPTRNELTKKTLNYTSGGSDRCEIQGAISSATAYCFNSRNDNVIFYSMATYPEMSVCSVIFSGQIDINILIEAISGSNAEQSAFYAWFRSAWDSLSSVVSSGFSSVGVWFSEIKENVNNGFETVVSCLNDLSGSFEQVSSSNAEQSAFYAWFRSAWDDFIVDFDSLSSVVSSGFSSVGVWFSEIKENVASGFDSIHSILNSIRSILNAFYIDIWNVMGNGFNSINSNLNSIFTALDTHIYSRLYDVWSVIFNGFKDMRSGFNSIISKLDEVITAIKDGTPAMQEAAEQAQQKAEEIDNALGSASDSLNAVTRPDVDSSSVVPSTVTNGDFSNYTNVVTVIFQNETVTSMLMILVGFMLLSLILNGQRS